MNISVVGLGKLGSVLATVLADSGASVIGIDTDPGAVAAINEHRAPVSEPGLNELLAAQGRRISATTDLASAIAVSELTFVVLPTPSLPNGTFSMDYVLDACHSIGAALRRKSSYYLIVISSTVMPGSMDGFVRKVLEDTSGKMCGEDFGLCYNPEFIALGRVIADLRNPDMILIGESDARAGAMLEAVYGQVCRNRPQIMRMNFVNAELAKIAVNSFVTMKISFANTMAELCGRTEGADSAQVLGTIGMDSRVGQKYLQGGLGYGGPCFPRDNAAFSAFARQHGVEASLAESTDRVNRRQVELLRSRILELLPEDGTVAVLGLSYKPETPVVEEAQGVQLARALASAGHSVVVYDPQAIANARLVLGGSVRYAASMRECTEGAAVVVIVTPWEEFRSLPSCRVPVIDCWRILPAGEFPLYETIGLGPRNASLDVAAGVLSIG